MEYFAKVSDYWISKGGMVVGLGSIKDIPTVEAIYSNLNEESKPHFINIAGKTNLTEALDIVGQCTAAVCNDSGLMHTVAAADVPQVCILVQPQLTTHRHYLIKLSALNLTRNVILALKEPVNMVLMLV